MASLVSVDEPKLKDFYFERKLGSGTYATVYKAINKVSGERECLD